MPDYVVTWTIDITADNPREAAAQALEIQRRVGSSAVVFDVLDNKGDTTVVDLDQPASTDYQK